MIEMIKNRRSVRNFKDTPVAKEMLTEILDCGRMAPTAGNSQPWLLGCITDKIMLEKLADIIPNGKFIKNSQACFTVFCLKDRNWNVEDGCAATMNIIYGAAANGLGTCWVWGYGSPYADKVKKLLNVPEKYMLISLIPSGYGEEPEIPEKKDLQEISFWNAFA